MPDPIKIQKVKAFVVLKPGYVPTESCKQEILAYCRKHIAKYAMPYDIEFREELPKTLVGKVAYRVLEEEAKAQHIRTFFDACRSDEPDKFYEKLEKFCTSTK